MKKGHKLSDGISHINYQHLRINKESCNSARKKNPIKILVEDTNRLYAR